MSFSTTSDDEEKSHPDLYSLRVGNLHSTHAPFLKLLTWTACPASLLRSLPRSSFTEGKVEPRADHVHPGHSPLPWWILTLDVCEEIPSVCYLLS